jgi:Protein of unknown function, DUF547
MARVDPVTRRHSAWARRLGIALVGTVVCSLGAASPPAAAAAVDYGAYSRLLQVHVRPGTINSIRLNTVDYAAVRADPLYAAALRDFAAARLEHLGSERDRIALWVNAYNLLVIKAVLDQYPTRSIRDGGTLLQPIWKKKVGTVGGKEFALDEIEHGILRADFREPRVHFAIVCASLSCPDLRREPFVAEQLDAQLADQTRVFLANPTKGVVPGPGSRTARVSSIFKWFRDDFTGGVAEFIRANAGRDLAPSVAELADRGLSYLEYDWSLNDTARAR